MEDKLLRMVSLLICCVSLALPGEESGYYLDQSGEEERFIQRLVWEPDEHALRYEVVVEREDGKSFREALREFTTLGFIEFSLPAGKYRYKVLPYDLLGRPGTSSEWTYFEILQALKPELRNFYPSAFYLDEDTQWELNLTGRNLLPESEVYLRSLNAENRDIIPLNYSNSSSGSSAQLVFTFQQLTPGNYEIYIKNPGGLETSRGVFGISFRKAVNFYAEAAYSPFFPIYGDLNRLFNQAMFPLGATLRMSLIPFKQLWGSLGLELAADWHYFPTSSDDYDIALHVTGAQLYFLFMKLFPNQINALNFRVGGGMSMLVDFHVSYPNGVSESQNILVPQAGLGVSFLWLQWKPLFIEVGVDYVHWFTADKFQPGYVRPWIGLGRQF